MMHFSTKKTTLVLGLLTAVWGTAVLSQTFVRVVDNKGTVRNILEGWSPVLGSTTDIYNTDQGSVAIATKNPKATLHNAGSTILGFTAMADASGTLTAASTVDRYSGVVLTQTSANAVTLPLPTDPTPGRLFSVVNSSASTSPVMVSGMLLPKGFTAKFEYDGLAWLPVMAGGAATVPFSGLTAALADNAVDNTTFAQIWNWSTATTQNPLSLTAAALTTGSLLSLNAPALTTGTGINVTGGPALTTGSLIAASGAVAATTTKGLVNIQNTAASSTGTVATIQANSTAGSGLTVRANGNVGIGTAAPDTTLDVNGAVRLRGATSGFAQMTAAKVTNSYRVTLPDTAAIQASPLINDGTGKLLWGLVIPTWRWSGTYITGSVVYDPINEAVYRASAPIEAGVNLTDSRWVLLCSANSTAGVWTATDNATQLVYTNANLSTLKSSLALTSGDYETFSVPSGITGTASGGISGPGYVVLQGGGNLTLSGASTYTGVTTINAGSSLMLTNAANTLTANITINSAAKLQLDNAATLNSGGTYSYYITDNGSLVWNSSANQILAQVISGSGSLTLNNSSSTLTLKAANTYTGATTVTAGNLYIGDGTSTTPTIACASGSSSSIAVAVGGVVRWNNVPNTTSVASFYNTITGAGKLQFEGTNSAYSSYSSYYLYGDMSGFSGSVDLDQSLISIQSQPTSSAIFNVGQNSTLRLASTSFNPFTINIKDGASWFYNGLPSAVGAIEIGTTTVTFPGNIVLNQSSSSSFQGGNSTIGTGFSSPPTITLSGVISGSGWFYQDQDYYSAGNSPYSYVILTGQNTFTGNIRIGLYNSGSILSIAGSGTLGLGNYAGNIFSVGTFKYLSTADQTLSGVISGSGSILKDTGTGILTLTGNNTYSGTTSCYAGKISIKGAGNVLNAGIVIGPSAKVQVDNAGVLNSSSTFSSTITTNGDFYWNSSADQVLSGVISGTGNLTMNGSGKLTLTANDSYSGATTVNAGTIYVQGASSNGGLMYSTPVTIATGAKLELSNSYYSLLQSGASSPVLNVNGTLQIDGNYHVWYPTTTTLNNGTILVPSSGVVSYGSICIGAARTITGTGNSYIIGTGTNGAGTYGIGFNGGNGPLTFNVPSASDVLTVGCDIANGTFAGYIAKTGTGTLILKGNNSYGGSTTVSAGTVKCGSASALGGSSAIINDGTIDLNGYSETIGYLEESTGVATGKITNTTSTPVTLTIAQIASNTSYPYNGIIEDGSAKTSLAISNAYATYLTGANTYTGTTTVASGSTLSIGNGGTTGSISDGASGTAITNLGTLQYYNTTGDTWANTLTGTGTFSIAAGTLTLTGTANTLTTGTIGISTGATLQTDGAGVLNTSVTGYTGTINDSGLLVWKSSQAAKLSGVISGIGGLTLNNSSTTLTLMGADTYTGATTVTAGNLYIGDGTSTTPVISGSSAVSIASGATMRLWNNYSTGTSKTIANTITGAGTLEFYGNASASNAYSQYYISGNISGFTGTVNLYESMYQGAASYSFPASSATINIKSYGSLYNNNSGATIPSTINIQDGAGWPVSTSSLGAIVANASVTNISGNVVLNQTTAMSNGYNGTVGTNSTNYQINFSGVISGSGWFKQDQYTLGTTVYSRVALTGQNTFTGPIAIGMVSSVFQLSGTGNLGSGNYAGNIANTGTFEYSSTGGQTLSGVISGTGVLTKDTGTGTLTLTGNNTYTGATTCNAGTISIQGSANVLTGNMTIGTSGTVQVDNAGVLNSSGTYSGTIADAGAFNWNSSVGSILSGVISGAGSFTKNGSGTVTLAANETYTGATNVNSGILLVKGSSGNGGLAYSTPVTIATSATLELDGTYPNQLQSSISGVLNVNGTLKIDGNNYDQWNMTTTSLNNGTISLPAIGNATYGTIYIIAAKTFTATGNSSITGGTYGIYLNGANLTTAVTNSSDNLTISCNIVGNANGITKTGSGVLYLNGTNGYMGATTISAGSVGGTGSSTSSAHTVATGAAIFGGLGVGSAGTYSPGALTFSAAASLLQVNTDGGSGVSVVDCGAKTITATSGFTVNITGALNVGTYYILKSTGTLPSVVPTVGTNSTGHTVTFSWVAGTGLKMVVS